jgi:hypothetical protein
MAAGSRSKSLFGQKKKGTPTTGRQYALFFEVCG